MNYGVELEFEVFENDISISADEILYDEHRNKHIGLDGNPSVGEIRSNIKPSVYLAMRSAIYYLNTFAESTTSSIKIGFNKIYATGIHIHFGINNETSNIEHRIKYKNVMTYAMKLLLPLYMKWNNPKRLNSSYWFNDATEDKQWGFEFRLIPSAFIKDRNFKFIIRFIDHLSLLIYNNISMEEKNLKKFVRLQILEVILDMVMSDQIESNSGITKDLISRIKKNNRINLYSNCNCEGIYELKTVVKNSYDKRHSIIVDDYVYQKVNNIRTFLKLYDNTVLFFPGVFILKQNNDTINLLKDNLNNNGYEHFVKLYKKIKSRSLKNKTSVTVNTI